MQESLDLVKLEARIDLTEKTKQWIREIANPDVWFLQDGEITYFQEHGHTLNNLFLSSGQLIVDGFFIGLGIPRSQLPKVEIKRYNHGSWLIEATIVLASTATTLHTFFKNISTLPSIIDGLQELRSRFSEKFLKDASKATFEDLKQQSIRYSLPSPPEESPLRMTLDLDDKPIRELAQSRDVGIVYTLCSADVERIEAATRQLGSINERLATIASHTENIEKIHRIAHLHSQNANVNNKRTSDLLEELKKRNNLLIVICVTLLLVLIGAILQPSGKLAPDDAAKLRSQLSDTIGTVVILSERIDEFEKDMTSRIDKTQEILINNVEMVSQTNELLVDLGREISQGN